MKKKVLLLITLVVSLFIYSGNVNAIVMWMQCTDDATGEMVFNPKVGNDKTQFAKYNTFAVINSYNSTGNSIRHVLYSGGTDDEGNSNFFKVEGPTFIANQDGKDPKYEKKSCWFSKESSQKGVGKDSKNNDLTLCDIPDENDPPLVDVSKLNDGICPVSVYQITGIQAAGSVSGDYVVMTGVKEANPSNIEVLNGYKIVVYRVDQTRKYRDTQNELKENIISFWVIEVYDKNGIYGNLFSLTPEEAANYSIFQSQIEDNLKKFKKGDFKVFYDQLLDLKINSESTITPVTFGVVANGKYDFATGDYVDVGQAIQLIKLYYHGRNYYKLTEYDKYPKVLIGNLGGIYSGSHKEGGSFTIPSDFIRAYENNGKMNVWDEVNEWKDGVVESLSNQNAVYSNFSDGGKYYDLLNIALKVSDSIDNGKKYDLPVDNNGKLVDLDNTIKKLNDMHDDLGKLLNHDYRYPQYKAVDTEYWTSWNGAAVPVKGVKCEQDGYTDKASYSLSDYVSCKYFNAPIDYALKNFMGNNISIVAKTFESSLFDQLKYLGIKSDFLDIDSSVEKYAVSLAKYIAYINKNYSDNLSEEQKEKLNEVLEKYLDFYRENFKKEIVLDCDTLLGKNFMEKIEKYVDIIKISIPILLIGFGIYEFASAIFSGDDEKMKKAQKKFMMRILIAILFFLLPFIIKIILSIANKAWDFISPSSCNFL